jgi:hypothetical protein
VNRNYNCHSCTEPLKILPTFHQYIVWNGPTKQRCSMCGAVHLVTVDTVTLETPGVLVARLSAVYDFPEYKPYRTGAYRVWFKGIYKPAKRLAFWDGEFWRNGPVTFSDGSIHRWQGLGGDNEHTKKMPYEHDPPFPFARMEYNTDEDGLQ